MPTSRHRLFVGLLAVAAILSACASAAPGLVRVAVTVPRGAARGERRAALERGRQVLVLELMEVRGVDVLGLLDGDGGVHGAVAGIDAAPSRRLARAAARDAGLTHLLVVTEQGAPGADVGDAALTLSLIQASDGAVVWRGRLGLGALADGAVAAVDQLADSLSLAGRPRPQGPAAAAARLDAARATVAGWGALRQGQLAEAIAAFRRVPEARARVSALRGVAEALTERGDLPLARDAMAQAVALNAAVSLNRRRLADLEYALGDLAARELFAAGHDGAATGDPEAALAHLQASARLDAEPNPLRALRAHATIGRLYVLLRGRGGDPARALSSFRAALAAASRTAARDRREALDVVERVVGALHRLHDDLIAESQAPRDCAGATTLHDAAVAGDPVAVSALLSAGAAVDGRDLLFQTPLHRAARWDQAAVVTALVAAGAALDARDERGRTPLHVAAGAGAVAVVDALIAAGADVDAVDGRLETPLHRATRGDLPEVIARLTAGGGAAVEARDGGERTPLHLAAARGAVAAARALLARGAAVGARGRGGVQPLHLAAAATEGGGPVVVALIEAGADPAARDDAERTPLHLAAEAGAVAVIEALLAGGARPRARDGAGLTPLDVALEHNQLAAARRLFFADKDEEAAPADADDRLLLRVLRRHGGAALVAAALDEGASAAAVGEDGRTALMIAAANGQVEVVRLLIARGACPAPSDPSGRTALHWAVLGGRLDVARVLVEAGADLAAVDAHGATAGHYALVVAGTWSSEEVLSPSDEGDLSWLAVPGDEGDLSWLAVRGTEAALRRALGGRRDAASAVGPAGLSPLHLAVMRGRRGAVEVLLDAGVDVEVTVAPWAVWPELAGATAAELAFGCARGEDEIGQLLAARGARLDLDRAQRIAIVFESWPPGGHSGGRGTIGYGREGSRGGGASDVRDAAASAGASVPVTAPSRRGGHGVAALGPETLGLQIREREVAADVLTFDQVLGPPSPDPRREVVARWCAGARDDVALARELRDQRLAWRLDLTRATVPLALVDHNLGRALTFTGARVEAEALLTSARRALGEHPDARRQAAENLGDLYARTGRYAEAEALLAPVLAARRAGGASDGGLAALTLSHLANLWTDAGRYLRARDAFEALVAVRAAQGDERPLATALNNQGVLLDLLGDRAAAAKAWEEMLRVASEAGPPELLAAALNNVAYVRLRAGQADRARRLAGEALAALDEVADERPSHVRGRALTTRARAEEALGEREAALATLEAAQRAVEAAHGPLHGLVADVLRRRAALLEALGRAAEARERLADALALVQVTSSPELSWRVYDAWAALELAAGRRGAAILFGKLAVNTLQGLRAEARGVGAGLEASYLAERVPPYRRLANALVDEGRLIEAQVVLDMLKDEEHFAFTRAARRGAPAAPMVAFEREAVRALQAGGDAPRDDRAALKRYLKGARRRLMASLLALNQEAEALKSQAIEARLEQLSESRIQDLKKLLEDRAMAPHRPAFVQLFLSDDRVRALVTLPGQATRVYERPVAVKRVYAQVARLREQLEDDASNPKPLARELYDVLLGPLRADLEAAEVDTLMVWLDGALRYLPLAALHDGAGWLIERFRFAIYTPVTHSSLKDPRPPAWRVAALGMSKESDEFDALTGVPAELEAIVAREDAQGDAGAIPGRVFLDEAFTADALSGALGDEAYQAVHIASHYSFDPQGDGGSFLLLGDGARFTLHAVREVRRRGRLGLLTFSACSTAVGLGALDGAESSDDPLGLEVEGLANVVQDELATGVLATLWPVVDASTSALMQRLYAKLQGDAAPSKAEALRQAQLALLESDDWAHPRFWAPFILMGNWL